MTDESTTPLEPESTPPEVSAENPAASAETATHVVDAPEPPAAPVPPAAPPYTPPAPPSPVTGIGFTPAPKSRIVAGVLGILLGGFGVHKFYLGYQKEGLIMLAGSLLWIVDLGWISWLVGFVEGVIYLTKSDEEFYNTYVAGSKTWF